MTTFYRRSLLLRAGLAMAGITLLALVSMGTSVIIAERLKGQAAAMNQAGSLRMQSFAITTRLLSEEGFADMNYGQSVSQAVQEFEERLLHPRLARVLGDTPLRKTLGERSRERLETFKPAVVQERLRQVLRSRLGLELR